MKKAEELNRERARGTTPQAQEEASGRAAAVASHAGPPGANTTSEHPAASQTGSYGGSSQTPQAITSTAATNPRRGSGGQQTGAFSYLEILNLQVARKSLGFGLSGLRAKVWLRFANDFVVRRLSLRNEVL
jgi:hypothetical protein